MSHYISTFLYEPLARQARRFSASGNISAVESGSTSEDANPTGGQEIQTSVEQTNRPMTGLENERGTSGITGQPVVHSPMHEDVVWEPETESYEPRASGVSSIMDGSSTPTDHVQRDSGRPRLDNGVTDRPSSQFSGRFSDRLLSRNTSVSSSIYEAGLAYNNNPGRSRRNTVEDEIMRNTGRFSTQTGDGVLPEDDGMGFMRKEIIGIQNMDISNLEKSRKMHELMTHQYSSYRSSLPSHLPRTQSPGTLQSQDRPFTPSSGHSTGDVMQSSPPTTNVSSISDQENSCYVTAEDLIPTYYIPPSSAIPRSSIDSTEIDSTDDFVDSDMRKDRDRPLGCAHYKRNVKLQCSACYRWYTCRFCHDQVEEHSLIRRETKNMLCMLCGCAQPVAEQCRDCGERGAWYYCGVCKLWDDDLEKYIYHCDDCGICRLGKGLGKDFYHCKTCGVCLDISIRDMHRCVERSTDCDCPICGEYLFNSQQDVRLMRCGHSIHLSCYHEHAKNSYKCPICNRSMMNMEIQFRHLDQSIESQPMPEEFRDTKAWVYCNDCSAKTEVKYHWLGLKCAVCDSYNTSQISITRALRPTSDMVVLQEGELGESLNTAGLILPEEVQSFTRGRPQVAAGLIRHSGISAEAFDRVNIQTAQPQRLETQSASASAVERETPAELCRNALDNTEVMEINDSETIDDEDEVDFWGRESPRGKPPVHTQSKALDDGQFSDDEEEDDEDDLMDDELEDDEDEEEDDYMALVGHR